MYFMILILALVFFVFFVVGRKSQDRIVSGQSPFSFAEDMLIIQTGAGFSIPSSRVQRIILRFSPNALQNRFYDMKIKLVKTDGSSKSFRYRGSGSGAKPQAMASELMAHHIECTINE